MLHHTSRSYDREHNVRHDGLAGVDLSLGKTDLHGRKGLLLNTALVGYQNICSTLNFETPLFRCTFFDQSPLLKFQEMDYHQSAF